MPPDFNFKRNGIGVTELADQMSAAQTPQPEGGGIYCRTMQIPA